MKYKRVTSYRTITNEWIEKNQGHPLVTIGAIKNMLGQPTDNEKRRVVECVRLALAGVIGRIQAREWGYYARGERADELWTEALEYMLAKHVMYRMGVRDWQTNESLAGHEADLRDEIQAKLKRDQDFLEYYERVKALDERG